MFAQGVINPRLDGSGTPVPGETYGRIANGSAAGQGGNDPNAPPAASWLTVENRFPFPLTVGASPLESDALVAPQTVPALSRCCLPVDPYGDVAWQVAPDVFGGRAGSRNVPYQLHDEGAPSCTPLFTTMLQTGSPLTSDPLDAGTMPTFAIGANLRKELALIGANGALVTGRITWPPPISPDACILAVQLVLVGIDGGSHAWSNLTVQPAYDFATVGNSYFTTLSGQERRWQPLPDGLPDGSSVVISCPGAWGVVLKSGGGLVMHMQAGLWVGVPGGVPS